MTAQHDLPPLPGTGVDFTIDDKYRGSNSVQDRIIDSLHQDGWTLHRLFTNPNAVLPLPPVKFPAGRVYMFSDGMAVVVERATGRIVASLPIRAALRTLDELTPDVLEADTWASACWTRIADGGVDTQRRHHKQAFHDANGSLYIVRRMPNGTADVIKDGTILHEGVRNADEADELDLEPVIAEMVQYVVDHA